MGNSLNTPQQNNETPKKVVKTIEEPKFEFGSYKSKTNPRPGYFIAHDKVYYRGKQITGADAKTFKKLGKGMAKDKNGMYEKGILAKR